MLALNGNPRVDVYLIDTEGHDAKIVRQIDLEAAPPALIIYEHEHLEYGERESCMDRLLCAGYRVIVEGSPNIEQETSFRGALDNDPNSGGCLSTGMRAVNAIPAVCAAPPGILSALDLPLIPGRHNMR